MRRALARWSISGWYSLAMRRGSSEGMRPMLSVWARLCSGITIIATSASSQMRAGAGRYCIMCFPGIAMLIARSARLRDSFAVAPGLERHRDAARLAHANVIGTLTRGNFSAVIESDQMGRIQCGGCHGLG